MTGLKIKKRLLLITVGAIVSISCFSQDTAMHYPDHTLVPVAAPTEEIFYKGSVQGGGGVVYALSNKALRLTLGGDYEGHVSGNFVIAPHIYTGLELESVQFGNTEYGANIPTIMYVYCVGAKIGYYTFMKNDFLFCYSLSLGPTQIRFSDTPNPAPKGGFKSTSFFMTPNFLASYRVNNELRIGLEITYTLLGYRFDPTVTGLDQALNPYNPSYGNGVTMYIEWGFGIYYAFDEGKRK